MKSEDRQRRTNVKRPTRNVRCKKYGECLDRAVQAGGAGFDCRGCQHERDESPLPIFEVENAILLLWAILKPDLFRKVRKEENRNRLKELGPCL